MSEIDIKDLSNEPVESPFFARYLEGQLSDEEQKTVVGGLMLSIQTKKAPSDQDEESIGMITTEKYPSDSDECSYPVPLIW